MLNYHINNNKLTFSFYTDIKRVSKKITVFLTDLKGNILIEQNGIDAIDISSHPNGNYIVFLTDSVGGLISKIRVIKP